MSMKIRKIMRKETKAKLLFAGAIVWVVAMIAIPYFVGVLSHQPVTEITWEEVEVPISATPQSTESEPASTEATPEEPAPEPAADPAPEVVYTYTETTTAQPAASTTPVEQPQPQSQSQPQSGSSVDNPGATDDGHTSDGIDNPGADQSLYTP